MHIENFDVLSILGEGSTSITFLAKPVAHLEGILANDVYALRMHKGDTISSSVFHESLLREHHNMRHVDHHMVAKQLYYGVKREPYFSILKAYSGLNLYQWRQQHVPNLEQLFRFTFHMLLLLQDIHAKRVVHGDIKPQNILVDNGSFVLCDMFASYHLNRPYFSVKTFCGTIRYASPEYMKDKTVAPAADYYSLGMTLFFLLTNFEPLDEWTSQDVLRALETLGISPLFMYVFEALLEEDPDRRVIRCQYLLQWCSTLAACEGIDPHLLAQLRRRQPKRIFLRG